MYLQGSMRRPMINFCNKKTISLLAPNEVRSRAPRATIVVCGSPRGGTSFAAYALFNMGLFMGKQIGTVNYEDQDLLNALEDQKTFLHIAEDRNVNYTRWGFKIPTAVKHLQWMAVKLRNPIFVVVYRNPLSIAQSILKRDPNAERDLMASIGHGLGFMQFATLGISQTGVPSVLIDFEKAKSSPSKFLDEMSEALGIPITESTRQSTISGLTQDDYSFSAPREGVSFI